MDTIDVIYAQTQPRTVAGGLRPHPSMTGLRPEPDSEQLERGEKLEGDFEIDGCDYLKDFVRELTF